MTDAIMHSKTGVLDMEVQRKRKPVVVSLSPAQLEALDHEANKAGMNRSEYIRSLLMDAIKGFPDDLMAHGEMLNKPPESL